MSAQAISPKDQVVEFLRGCLTEKIQKNSRYSSRAFARDIGVSPAFVSMLLAGKKKLSLDRAKKIVIALDMSERQSSQFLRAVALSSLPSDSHSSEDLENLLFNRRERKDIYAMEVDQFKFFSNWYNVAILDLTTCSNFQSDINWIANRLQISPIVVQDATDRLLRLGLLKKEKGILKKTNKHIAIPTSAPASTIRNFHQQMIEKAKDHLNSQEASDFIRRDISSITFSIDARKVEEAKKLINDFKNQMADFLTEGQCNDVYQMNIQFFPLTKSEAKK
tara:strand:+ start:33019 stop:33852 length:834 start_codon:yes stop_codon:yes gene_type:complete